MKLTREKLHQLVWASPLDDVAASLGLTHKELDVLLKKLDVPFPYSGYWTGQPASPSRSRKLPRAKPGTPDAVEIEAAAPRRPRAPPRVAPEPLGQSLGPSASEPIDVPIASVPDAPNPTRLTDPHRIIAARIEEEKRSARGSGGWRPNPQLQEAIGRRRLIESRLFKALEAAGHAVRIERGSLQLVALVVKGQTITHAIRERYKQKRRPLTPEELRDPLNVRMDRQYAVERFLTGQLILSAEARGVFPKVEWSDKPDRPLELQVDEMVQGLEALADQAVQRETQRRDEERQRWEVQRQREAERRERQQDENQWRHFRELATRHAESASVRSFIEALKRGSPDEGAQGQELAEWIRWAETRLAAWDPLQREPQALMIEVKAVTADDDRR